MRLHLNVERFVGTVEKISEQESSKTVQMVAKVLAELGKRIPGKFIEKICGLKIYTVESGPDFKPASYHTIRGNDNISQAKIHHFFWGEEMVGLIHKHMLNC